MCSLGHSFRQYLPSANAAKKLFERDNLHHPVDGGHERLLRDIEHDMARQKSFPALSRRWQQRCCTEFRPA
jgi:hypothetical protein